MRLFGQYLFTETRRCVEQSIRLNVIGRRDRLSDSLLRSIEQSERMSAGGTGMHLRIAIDYSSQYSIVEAARRAARDADLTADGFQAPAARGRSLRVSRRRSGFADPHRQRAAAERFSLWECAYAELYFADCLWPEFDERRFHQALDAFAGRQRRFGALGGDKR